MEHLLLARVDDRLIHGQVMTAWMKLLPAKEILIADDKVAKDPFMTQVLTMAAPGGVKVKVYSVEQAAQALKEGLKAPSIMLAKTPLTYKKIMDLGAEIPEINIGGMGAGGDRKQFYRNISMSEEEIDILRELSEAGSAFNIRIIAEDGEIDISKMLDK